jgi:hypothetical protein
VFDKFSKCHKNILLGDFNAKVGREDIFKPTIGNESLHESSHDNGVRLINFATSKNFTVKSTMLSHRTVPIKLVLLIKMCLHETYSYVRISKHLSDNFPIQNGLKQEDALSPLLFNFALKYAIGKVQDNQVGLKLNVNQRLAYADGVNILGDNIVTIKKNTGTLIDATKKVGLEINVEKNKYMLLSRHQNAGQNRDIKRANRLFEYV